MLFIVSILISRLQPPVVALYTICSAPFTRCLPTGRRRHWNRQQEITPLRNSTRVLSQFMVKQKSLKVIDFYGHYSCYTLNKFQVQAPTKEKLFFHLTAAAVLLTSQAPPPSPKPHHFLLITPASNLATGRNRVVHLHLPQRGSQRQEPEPQPSPRPGSSRGHCPA